MYVIRGCSEGLGVRCWFGLIMVGVNMDFMSRIGGIV